MESFGEVDLGEHLGAGYVAGKGPEVREGVDIKDSQLVQEAVVPDRPEGSV